MSGNESRYETTGKYLFFNQDKEKLIAIATNEIEKHGFHKAKVNDKLLDGQSEHVLCPHYEDDSREDEITDRNREEYGVKYRYWKSNATTRRGEYSEEFLEKLSKSERDYFTRPKNR
ncbi:hypothetical protein MUP77_08400 [Candidatus Bathyarchaeota archaeon]|nr:hypothetical protein [Candidatus Bathyarchaeota archaeon]